MRQVDQEYINSCELWELAVKNIIETEEIELENAKRDIEFYNSMLCQKTKYINIIETRIATNRLSIVKMREDLNQFILETNDKSN